MSNPLTTPLDTRQSLARLLPDVIRFDKDSTFGFTKNKGMGLMWIEENRPVRDTELRHLVDLAEARLTEDQKPRYVEMLVRMTMDEPGSTWWCIRTASVDTAVLALARVHATEDKK